MANSTILSQKDRIRELLETASNIGIIVSKDHNFDTMAAALGLYLSLVNSGKNTQIVSLKAPLVEVSNLVGINKVSSSFDGNAKILTISVPYREGEIEKVSYNIEGDLLNVNLFAEENGITFSEKDIKYIKKGSSPSLIITVGISNEQEISSLVDLNAVKTIHIDKSGTNALVGDASIIDPTFSSVSEIVSELIKELGLIEDVDVAQNLMDGIVYSTRNFTLPETSPFAFEAAGFLLQAGAKRQSRNSKPERFDRNQPQQRQRVQENRGQNFPNERHFLNDQPRRPMTNNQSGIIDATAQPQPDVMDNQVVKKPVEPISLDQVEQEPIYSEADDQNHKEPQVPDEIPEDWFLPKVFKGTKKGN